MGETDTPFPRSSWQPGHRETFVCDSRNRRSFLEVEFWNPERPPDAGRPCPSSSSSCSSRCPSRGSLRRHLLPAHGVPAGWLRSAHGVPAGRLRSAHRLAWGDGDSQQASPRHRGSGTLEMRLARLKSWFFSFSSAFITQPHVTGSCRTGASRLQHAQTMKHRPSSSLVKENPPPQDRQGLPLLIPGGNYGLFLQQILLDPRTSARLHWPPQEVRRWGRIVLLRSRTGD